MPQLTLAWIPIGVVGAILMMAGSRAAVRHAAALAVKLEVPPFLVGISIVALGTDLPEIVNSVVSSSVGHGDINVGDSIGSVFTQGSLVLGLVPFVAYRALVVSRREVGLLSGLTVLALGIGVLLMADGELSRADAVALVLCWIAATAAVWRFSEPLHRAELAEPAYGSVFRHAALALLALAVVGAGAAGLVHAVIAVSGVLGIPEYVLSFFAAALGTSLPELVVDLTAMRRGLREMALGGVLGACLMDASVSIAAGPLLFPIAVTTDLALRGALGAAGAMLLGALLLGIRGVHDRISGAILIASYLLAYLAFAVSR